jgi:tetratricopeptide (TPR) repeat protein
MATIPVSTDPADTAAAPRRARPSLWSAPLFVVGVAALVTVWFLRPLWPDGGARRFDHNLQAALALLNNAGDGNEALKYLNPTLDQLDKFPNRAGEVNLLAGSAHIRIAEADTGGNSSHWQTALEHLKEAESRGVPPEMQPNLSYRLAKAEFHIPGSDTSDIIHRLTEVEAICENQGECYSMLTQAYSQLPTPDIKKAIYYNEKLRNGATLPNDGTLADAKIQGAELLAKQGEWEKARKAIEQINDQAPPALQVRALLLRGRSFQEEHNWSEAARVYNLALNDTRLKLPQPALLYYHLGLCYRQLEQPAEAASAWQECIKLGDGPEAQVSAVHLADLVDPSNAERSVEAVRKALASVKTVGDWTNPYLDLAGVRAGLEHISQGLRQAGRFDLALQTIDLYDRVAPAGRTLVMRGEACAEWARVHRDQAAKLAATRPAPTSEEKHDDGPMLTPVKTTSGTESNDARAAEERAANDLFLQAATAFSEAARQPGLSSGEQSGFLWTSAGHYLSAGDWARGSEQLELVLKIDHDASRQGEGWYRLADAYRNQNKMPGAKAAYRKAMEFETRFAYLARYELAMASLAEGDPNEAVETLTTNLKLLRYAPDAEAQEKTMYKLGILLHERKDYQNAVRHLEMAIHSFKDNSEVPKARFLLANSYWQIANQETSFLLVENMTEEKRAHFTVEYRRWLEKAADEFSKLDADLDKTPSDTLSPDQRLQVPFIAAKCLFNLGRFNDALQIYDRLSRRYKDRVEMLDALGGCVKCHAALSEGPNDKVAEKKIRQRLVQIDVALEKMEESVRKPWKEWVHACQNNLSRNESAP